jgi:hypothetical protein
MRYWSMKINAEPYIMRSCLRIPKQLKTVSAIFKYNVCMKMNANIADGFSQVSANCCRFEKTQKVFDVSAAGVSTIGFRFFSAFNCRRFIAIQLTCVQLFF